MKKFTDSLILVEPNRLKKEDLEYLNSIKLDLDELKGYSKVWIWKKNGQIVFTKKTKGNVISKMNIDLSKVQTFSLNDVDEGLSDIDEILDKINVSGIESLTEKEKRILMNL